MSTRDTRIGDFEKLSPAKQKLLLARLRKREEAEQRAEGIPPSPLRRTGEPDKTGEPFPLSFAQQRLWFIDRMVPGASVYNVADALLLDGRLDVPALESTLGAIVRRHETLRTVFDTVEGRPVQRVEPAGSDRFPIPVIDLAGLDAERAEAEGRRIAEAEAVLPFDVPRGPHLRARLARLGAERWLALLTMHHIVSDGWSMGVLVRELGAFYRAFAGGAPADLPVLPIQYPDFADWQRATLQGEVLDEHLRWWRERLAGAPPTLDLPTDLPRPPVQRHRGAALRDLLPPDVTEAVAALARERGGTAFMVLLAAFALHLARHAGQDDVVIGSPVANRNRIDTEGLIGFFVNTLALRVDAAERPARTFLDLLDEVRGTTLGAYAHQDLPFERIVEELKPERDLSRSPVYQVAFALQNAPVGDLELPGLTLAALPLPPAAAVVDLSLEAVETPDGIAADWRFDTDLFAAPTVRRMAERFGVLLRAAVADPSRPLEALPMLSAAEQEQVLAEWSAGPPAEEVPLFPGQFAAWVERTPEAPAVLFGDEVRTYAELAARAGGLARWLLAQEAGAEARAGICLERSPDLIASVLGALAAGVPFVPLDPGYPADRLAYMAADAGIAFLLTTRALAGRVELPEGVRTLFLDECAGLGALPDARFDPDRLAYVLYTSGSTGRPKGVMVAHRGLANLAAAQRALFRTQPASRVLQFASPSFDASVWEMTMALGAGGSLRLAPREALLPGPDFARNLAEWGITHVTLPPSALAVTPPEGLSDLACLLAGGEACPPAVAEKWAPGRLFINAYGPTEGTVCDTVALFSEGTGLDGVRVPIGRPLPGIEAFVVDRRLRPAPVGVPGELWIGGLGLARGYRGRPDLTAERFVPHPFAAARSARLYRTGDLVRWRDDGQLDILGRIDRQVKVRGVRIEPGEIEGILAQHPDVHDVAVALRPHAGGPRLVAWIVTQNPQSSFRAWAAEHLPEALVPAAFVVVPEMPLTPAGKVDRDALPDPAAKTAAAVPAAPRTGLESVIAEIWREVLGVEQVGREESFFGLGGHSLLLVEVQSRLRTRLDREVPVLDLFRYPDIASLARHLAGETAETETLVPVRERPVAIGSRDVAVIGLACRFPQAPSPEAFWENLRSGVEAIRFFSEEELREAGVDPALLADPSYVRASGVLDDADRFDAPFFDISPREAQILDPQQRVLLECAAEALERAGHGAGSPALAGKRVGVFAGTGMSVYGISVASVPGVDGFEATLANDKDFIATRIAYELDLRGPALCVQTACSTSLVAVHLACKALLDGECELALAGGVTIQFPQVTGYLWREGGITSPDGHNRAFDAAARGTVGGNGAGIVVLKPLAAALADGDPVHAVIKATALNNDGSEKIGFTAPSERGEAGVIAEAQELAGVPPETIGYVEAHGSATPLGDPIEVAALMRAFRSRAAGAPAPRPVALGSVKTNIGHTGSAAGVAGLIKTVLALEHREIPPSLWYEKPNPRIDFAAGPFQVATGLTPWEPAPGVPRRAGVSSFGLGGTNAHAIVEEAPERVGGGAGRSRALIALSARTPTALETATDRLAMHLRERPEIPLADVAFTLLTGRKAHEHRRIVVATDAIDVAAALEARDPRRVLSGSTDGAPRAVAFVLAGLGEQYPGLARGLYEEEPVFREELDRCAELLAPRLGLDVREALFAASQETKSGGLDLRRMLGRAGAAEAGPLDRTEVLQPALFAVEYALARLWMSWGIVPAALIGYSLGEYVAACLAEVFSLEEALRLVAERARWIGEMPAGAMLAVPLPEPELRPWIDPLTGGMELDLAATNGPRTCVVSGPPEAVEELERRLAAAGHPARRLRTTHAFHSRAMGPVAGRLIDLVREIGPRPPRIPLLSNATGTWMTGEQAEDPRSWAEHLLRPVRFAEGIAELWSEPGRVLLEIGPGQSLSSLALQHPAAARAGDPVALPSLPSSYESRHDLETLLGTLGKLWLAGVAADWQKVWTREERRRVELPTYPFERQRYWLQGEPGRAPEAPALPSADLDELARETEALLATMRGADLGAIEEHATKLAALLGRLQEGRGRGPAEPPPAAISFHPRPGLRTAYVEPANELERMVASLWQRLLGIDQVGRHDSFFDLGGDSLLATQALTRVRDAFGVDIPLPSLFEDPTPAGAAVLIERLRGGATDQAPRETIPRQPRDGRTFPTSFAQERLWVIDQIEPGSLAYNLPTALRLSGRLRLDLLARVFAEIVRRHETLRTTFARGSGGPPVQILHPPGPVPIPRLDLAALPPAAREAEVRRLAIEEGSTPFDLESGPVLRIRLLHLAAEEHALLLTLHHIASDGWSSGVLVQEIAALYDAFAHGRPSPLPELPVQYADYAAWQRQTFQGPEIAAALDWWSRRLADAPVLELPTDRPRPAVQGTGGSFATLQIPGSLAKDLESLARQEGATLFMAVTAVFQALLARLSGQDDLTVGTPVANRHHSEVEGLIGFFVNTLVLRTDLSGDPTFRELLARVRRVSLEALEHGQVPFSQVVETIRPERSLSHTPLFQVMVQLANAPGGTLEIPGLRFTPLDAPLDSAMFDLNLTVVEVPGGMNAMLEYRTDLFDRTTAQRLLERYAGMLRAVALDRRVSELPVLTEGERQAIVEWEFTPWPPLPSPTLPPGEGETALVHNGESWSFGEIQARVSRLAAQLQGMGIGPGSRVGIFAERSREMVEAVLATLLAGAAYVPLDPAYPAERLAFMREDAGVAVVLTREAIRGILDKDTGEAAFAAPLNLSASPHDLAYVIYTSGSTGRPKGVAMTRGALSNLLAWQRAVLPGPARTLQFASLSFDVSFQEIVSTWTTGGTLVLVDEETRRDPFALLELLDRERVERLFLPFVALRQLAEAAGSAGIGGSPLRDVVTAGEQLQVTRAVRDWLGTIPGVRLHNQYGPTESHVVTALTLEGDPESWPGLPAIGRSLPNVPVRVLDAWLQPVPPGVRGELYLGGVALARGYLDRPDLTAERFLPDPLAETPGARLYRTGDLARWRSDGTLDYLGRRDHQVKIRGVRVEPGEVEAVLEEHPEVRQAVVLAVPEPGSEALRLVAWYVGTVEAAELRAFLQDRLPAAIVPSLFVPLEAFPVTPSGKVDRLALSRGHGLEGLSGPAPASTPPRTPTEERLAAIWRELLGVPQVGVEDNFFELGGHSLLATQLVSRIRELFRLEIPQRIIFEAPTLGGLALAIDPGSRPAGDVSAPIEPVPGDGPFPVSFAQERLWLIDQIERGGPAYNLPAALRLAGPLRPEVLAASLGAIVERHATLRTTYGAVHGVPVQTIAPPTPFVLPEIDLSALPAPEAEARRLDTEETLRPFDLARGPVLRALLLRFGWQEHVLLCTIHHIATDGWSTGIFAREMMELYGAFAHGLPSPLPPLPLRYVDYAVWQRRMFQGEVLAAALDYWRGQLAGVPALELPTDRPRTAVPDATGALAPFLASSDLAAGLHALGRREGSTLFMVLMAAFQALLSRHTGQTDIAVGTPVAGRDRTDLEGLIGFFVNTLVVRTDLSGAPSFREILARVRGVALAAFAHQQVPFEKLVGELNPDRNLAQSPLFQVLFVLQNAPGAALEIPGLAASPFQSEGTAAKFDLTLSLGEIGGRLGGGIEYRTALFDAATIRRLLDHFAILLAGAAAHPDQPLAELPLLPEAERHQVLTEWSQAEWGVVDEPLAVLFARQVEATPDAPALEDAAGPRLTYRELEQRSTELAHRLRELGVGPEVPVGILLERSADRVVAALAVIRAGGAYVPLDPAYPEERLAFLVADAGVGVVIGKDWPSPPAPLPQAGEGCRFGGLTVFQVAQTNPHPSPARGRGAGGEGSSPDALACLLYTSGSTGTPKGVAVVHRGIARLARWAGDLGIGSGDTILQLAPFAFDASTLEIWGALLNGARVVVPPPGTLSLEEIGEQVARHGVTVLWLTAGLFHQMVEGALERLAPVRLLLAGGDALSVPHVKRLLEALPGTRLVNGYGPTENTTFTACHLMTGAHSFAGSVPLGRPIEGTRVVVLDRTGRPVPVGVPGELCTGGAGLARGYRNRPDLTAASFVPDEGGERLYRTGDRARFLPDGRLEFLGRLDEQVKIRGFRVEPGEIEALLAAHPAVREAAVVAGQDAAGKRLVACVVLHPASPIAPSDLRAWLGGRLPEPMVPAAFVVLDALPLTPNGKVDRRALARLTPETPMGAWVAPATPAEEVLAGLWSGLLGVGRVGREDDFFALGGHSLLATQLVSRVREVFGVEIPLRTLFEAPTLAGLAAQIEAAGGIARAVSPQALPPITPVPRDEGPLPLSFAQERLWFLDELDPGTPTLNLPFSAWLRAPLDDALLARALEEVVRRHEVLRTTFGSVDGQPRQHIAPAFDVPLPAIDLRGLEAAARQREAFRLEGEETVLPFDLARGPLVRARMVRTGDAERLLLITVHHIAADGWSLGLLMRELRELYGAFAAGLPSPLPELPVQYADYAAWQRRWLGGEVLEAQITYWRGKLGGTLPVLDLPTDRPRPAVQTYRGGSVTHVLDPALSGRLAALGRREGATLFMVLLAAFQALLGRLAGQDDVIVGSPVAGRVRSETEALIGCFLNNLALRTDLGGDPPFRGLLGRARATALEAYEHQDVPFERLLEELRVERHLSRTPLFQVFLNMLNFPTEEGGLGGTDEGMTPEVPSKFDLTIYAGETAAGLRLELVYNADLFDRARMAELAVQLEILLARAAEDPEARIAGIPLLTPAARAVLPDPAQPLPGAWPGSVSGRVAEHARHRPAVIAAVGRNGGWTWGQIDTEAHRLARRLHQSGIGTGDLVAVFAHRGAGLAAALLGIWRTGAAFTILDPAYPPVRLAAIVDLARPGAVLHMAAAGMLPDELRERLAGALHVLLPERAPEWAPALQAPAEDLGIGIGPDDLAYVAFTSGSTGTPKAILGGHAPLSHFFDWHARRFELTAEDRFSVLSGLAHDPLLRDLFTPLWVGGTLCVPDPETMGEPGRLATWMASERVTIAHLTPAMGQLLTQSGGELPDLRRAFFGGDVLTGADLERLRRRAPRVEVVNFYGATETPQAMGWWPGAGERGAVPLGRGIEGVQLLVLNPAGDLAGIGEVGEIVIRTPYLALGYLGDPAATAERFSASAQGGRAYRTGDLGRYRPDSAVTFAGRADAQVKIRGFRVETGEIEAALVRHPAVREAAVVLEGEVLLAFAVLDPAGDASGLGGWLRGQLPAYMIPAAVVPLDRLPLTPNRKVDRRALARLGAEREQAPAAEAPKGPIEETLVAVWSDLLGIEPARIGIHAGFFDLGGHSLLATQLLSRIWDTFGIELPLFKVFEAPTVAGLAEAVATALRQGADEAAPLLVRVAPVPRESDLPLSFGQERLWFLHRLDPQSPAYNLPHSLRLDGPLDPAALAHAFGELVRRHEILRTRYTEVEGVPALVLDPVGSVLPLVDLSCLPAASREAEAGLWLQRDARMPFDLTVDHPLRTRLLRLGPTEHALSLTLHHIASDGWSNGLLVREVAELYRAFAVGRPAALPGLPVQYADFAAWQRDAFASGALDPQRAWWRERLSDPPAPLDLPTDRPRPAVPAIAGAWRPLDLPADLASAVDALGRRQGATLFMALLAAFATLLSRLSGQDDLTVGTPVAGRGRTELEGLIGFFVNTLVLRVGLVGDPSFTELLGRVRATALGAFVHQDVPFEDLVEELQPERDLAHPPLFQVLFVLQNTPAVDLEISGLTFRPIPADSGAATFDLTLSCAGDARGIGGLLQYKTDLFDAPTMDRWLGHLRNLLAAAVAQPERRLGDLPLLSLAERHQLVVEHNDTAAYRPGDLCLHELFERQVERTPDAVALVVAATGEEITYRDLDAHAGRLAAWLRARGVGPEVPVGVSLERSPELVMALLAVLKAGGSWVPLDPAYPPERLAFLIEDAAVTVLLDRASWPLDLPESPVRLSKEVTPDHLAYRIYTSGSTGRPKAVLVPHRAIVQHMRWLQEDWPLGPADVLLPSFSVSFDASFFDLWAPLLAGARLVLSAPGGAQDAARTAEEIALFGVTRISGVPPWLAELADRPELAGAKALRQVFAGGQELPADLARSLRARGWQVVSFYGPSEATVTATAWPAAPEPTERTVPIGRPLHNVRTYVVGAAAEPLPLGVPGELWIGGAGVARGYAGRPDLTADRFRPDPFGGPGTRAYRTGDRVRRRPDGVLEFLGRIDRQVKIRGFRIEPGEVEAALAAHPALRDAAVVARKTRSGEIRLIAYAVPREPVAVEELRAWLRERLPEPLVPAGWVLLDALPLTPNGKVDLAALPEPETMPSAGERVAPRDDLERALAALWEELLDVRPVGVQDDFFALGGHSLLVLRLLARIERQLGAKLPPSVLFTAPTIEKLAAVLREGRGAGAGPLIVLAPGGDRPPIVWAHAAAGTVTAYAELARRLREAAPDRPVWALQAPETLPATLEELAAEYVAALRAAQPEGPYHLAGWSFGGVVAFEIARQLRDAGSAVAPLTLIDSRAPGVQPIPEDLPAVLAAFAADQGLPPEVDPLDVETLRPLFETFRRLLGMLRIYRPEPYPGAIVLFRAEERAVPAPDDLGWTRLAGGGLEIRTLPGDHAGVIRGTGAERLAVEMAG